jgi:acetyl-CoA C-acetyltransferase
MNQAADLVAQRYGFSRNALDEYAVGSQARTESARLAGKFALEIVPFGTTMKVTDAASGASHMRDVRLDRDEGPRPGTTLETLAALAPFYPGGTATAGNAAPLSDGAAAVLMMDADLAARRCLPILGLFRGLQLSAVAPEEPCVAVTPAVRRLMTRHGLSVAEIDVWELHEASAVTVLYNQARLETPWERTNVNGGAIALGHPYGMSGVRYIGQTLMELGRRGASKAIVAVSTAGGQGTAAYLER